jgi:hypothetical protein
VDSAAFRVGAAFEAMLLAPVLRPMLAGTDAVGEYGVDLFARDVAERDRHGFAAVVAAALGARS